MSDQVNVSFEYLFGNLQTTLSDGFSRIDRSLEEVRRELNSKASNESVNNLKKDLADFEIRSENQVKEVHKRIDPLELAIATDAGVSKWKIRLGNAAVIFASSSVGAFLYYIVSLGGHS